MKIPDTIPAELLAVCGMNCLACYRHCAAKSAKLRCPGCLTDSSYKPNNCKLCKIRNCASENGLTRCFECGDFPCTLINNLEKSYNKRYGESLLANSEFARDSGIELFMEAERIKHFCPDCGGVVNLHDKICSDCSVNKKHK